MYVREIRHRMRIGAAGLMRSAGVLWLSAMTVIAVVSCGGDDESPAPEPPAPTPPAAEVPISFQGDLGDGQAVTRSTEIGLNTKYTAFRVWGYKNGTSGYQEVMNGYTVKWADNSSNTTTTNTHGWEYVDGNNQSIKYWDYSATAYRFFGVAPASHQCSVSSDDDEYVITFSGVDLSTSDGIAAAPYFSELWYSSDKSQYGKPVKLLFKQPVSKVRFRFTSDDPRIAADAVLSGISFRPTAGSKIYRKGNFTLRYPLTETATRETFVVTNTDGDTALDALTEHYTEANQKWYTVLPANGQGTYTLEVTINGGDPKTAIVPAEFMNWQPGFEYTYIFKINEEGGVSIDVVQSAFTVWVDDQTGKHDIYNW